MIRSQPHWGDDKRDGAKRPLDFDIAPRLGGKITSLRDWTGREWLAQPARTPEPVPPRETRFVDAEVSGWDECAPTITECRIGDVRVPDHGDLWAQEFEFHDNTVSATGTSLDYRFERRASITPEGVRLEYRAEALSTTIPFLWAAHPLFVAPAGTYVGLDAGVDTVVDVLAVDPQPTAWTHNLAAIDTVPRGGCRKIFVEPETAVQAARITHPDGAELSMTWSDECPYLGVWFDRGRYSREPVIALEPSTGFFDSVESALALDRVAILEPGRPLEWWVELVVTPSI